MPLRATPGQAPHGESEGVSRPTRGERPWLGVRFVCAGAYQRVYRTSDGSAYLARCPRCGKSIRFRVGTGGTNRRFFDVSC